MLDATCECGELVNVVCYAVYLLGWVLSIWQESYYIRRSITLVFGNYRQITLLFRMIVVVVDSGCASQ